MTSDKANALIERLNNIAQEIRDDTSLGFQSDVLQRARLVETARSIIDSVKQQLDSFVDQTSTICEIAATRLFTKWKVFELIPAEGSISFQDIAAKLEADVALIARVSSVLVAAGVLNQVGSDQISHTPASRQLATTDTARAMSQIVFDEHLPSFIAMPEYFEKHGLREPKGRRGTIVAHAAGCPDDTVWEIMNRDPARMVNFMHAMAGFEEAYPITAGYDFSWVVGAAAKGDAARATVVDVGGGKGHALKAICARTEGLEIGRCVLEDLPVVVEAVRAAIDPELKGVSLVGMDFHAEQPVKGALVYYIRRCLHDYDDDECVLMLRKLAEAMAPDSRLLIVEMVLGSPASRFGAMADFIMATIGGKERSQEAFQTITSKAQLKIQKIYQTAGTDVAVIECVKE